MIESGPMENAAVTTAFAASLVECVESGPRSNRSGKTDVGRLVISYLIFKA
jgi:hypothetical protein